MLKLFKVYSCHIAKLLQEKLLEFFVPRENVRSFLVMLYLFSLGQRDIIP